MPFSTKAILLGASVLALAHLCEGQGITESCDGFKEDLVFHDFVHTTSYCNSKFELTEYKPGDNAVISTSKPSEEDCSEGDIGGIEYTFEGKNLRISMHCCTDEKDKENTAACNLKSRGTKFEVTRTQNSRRRLLFFRHSRWKHQQKLSNSDMHGKATTVKQIWFKPASVIKGTSLITTHCLSETGNKCARSSTQFGYLNKKKRTVRGGANRRTPNVNFHHHRRRLLQSGKKPMC
jgi:hypothetical protein